MNINLSGASSSQSQKQGKGKSVGFGLNKRKKNVFDEEDDDGDSDNNDDNKTGGSRRDTVNREIAAEQAALRKRAIKAMSQQQGDDVYDYDGAYESFQPKKEDKPSESTDEAKKSRYVEDMLKSSKRRATERDVAYERKVAREQEQESNQEDFQGKEKFVTKAYKRKLEERKQLAEENAKQLERDEEDDVTKKRGGAAMASFYGNLNRNVAMGGTTSASADEPDTNKEHDKDEADHRKHDGEPTSLQASSGGVRRSGLSATAPRAPREGHENQNPLRTGDHSNNEVSSSHPYALKAEKEPEKELSPEEVRKRREEKVASARGRYFKRIGKGVTA
ncbi:Coiled-coil domain-containing protein 55 (DUF2040) [Seminavis robusta]|uniref:Coiled-coil domain-containing protein 55 (DUF2040) n=1 Tax=Seminavis robusta TaxID=568900 RepID=A0A9N8EWY9_9STRA|nr:Coiled-coil domain-containing protein 55 (DUF2040) [Seminavis robusta]|eukprot:Sro2191_g318360.1 Coiled-coil domain-containing protein 55 (DUF2040) (334) ;mRNA; f:10345-11577